MRKIISIVVILLLIIGGVWYFKNIKNIPSVPQTNEEIVQYENQNLGIAFAYPKILTASTTSVMATLHHDVPFVHHDYCDFKGEGDTTIDRLTDFHVTFQIINKGLVATMKQESPYIPEENFKNNTVVVSPGFIDSYNVENLKGYKIFEGAEGCGQITYYFVVSDKKTLLVREEFITVFSGAIDVENKSKAEAVPGVINKEKSVDIFESIMKTLEVM